MTVDVNNLNRAVRQRIRRILAEDPDFYVPIRKLFSEVAEEWKGTYEDFEQAIRAELGLAIIEEEHDQSLKPREAQDLEKAGFYQGPRVRLKERVPSYQDMVGILERHTSRMLDSLGQAYSLTANQLSAEEEDMMLDLLQNAKQLRTTVVELGKAGGQPSSAGKKKSTGKRHGRKEN